MTVAATAVLLAVAANVALFACALRNPHTVALVVAGLLSAAAMTGCAGSLLGAQIARATVRSAAASDHACPKDNVTVTWEDTETWIYNLTVCGTARRYRDVAGKQGFHFEIAPPPSAARP